MSRSTMILFVIAIPLLIYGYLCRLLSIYFFWDSKHFGWILLATGLMSFLIDRRLSRVAQKKNIFVVRIGVVILILAFAVAGGSVIVVRSSDAYDTAIETISTDPEVKNKIGDIRGFGLFPSGLGVADLMTESPSGTASFIITVRGNKAHTDVQVNLRPAGPMKWSVVGINMVRI